MAGSGSRIRALSSAPCHLSTIVAAAFDAEAIAEVVRQHHAEALEQRVFEEVGETDEPVAHGQPVVHVAEQDELAEDAPLS